MDSVSDATANDDEMQPRLLSKKTVCQLLDGVTTKHVENLVRSGRMPAPVYLGRIPRWRLEDLVRWMEDGCPIVDDVKQRMWRERYTS